MHYLKKRMSQQDIKTEGEVKTEPAGSGNITPEQKKARYIAMKKKLKELLNKRNALEDDVTKLEEDIYEKETKYLADGAVRGNVVRGFRNFSKTSSSSSRVRKIPFTDEDRIFSLSSSTYVMHLRKEQGEDDSTGPTLTSATPSFEDDENFTPERLTPSRRK